MESQNSCRGSHREAGGATDQLRRVTESGRWSHRSAEESHREAGGVTEQLRRVTERHVESQNS